MVCSAVIVMFELVGDSPLGATPWIAVLVYGLLLITLGDRPSFRRHSDDFLLGLLLLVLGAIGWMIPDPVGLFVSSSLIFPLFFVLLRWRGTRLLVLAVALLATALSSALRSEGEIQIALLILSPPLVGGMAWVGWRRTQRRLAAFYDEYRRQASVERDRVRMSEELSAARDVQLSMLPREPPEPLARVSHFKGDVQQEDDLTLVVLRMVGDAMG